MSTRICVLPWNMTAIEKEPLDSALTGDSVSMGVGASPKPIAAAAECGSALLVLFEFEAVEAG